MVKLIELLAEYPVYFTSSNSIISFRRWDASDQFSMTNKGLRLLVPLKAESSGEWVAYLDCYQVKDGERFAVGIPLHQLTQAGDQFARVSHGIIDIPLSLEHEVPVATRAIYIRKEIIQPDNVHRMEDVHRPKEFRLVQIPRYYSFARSHKSAMAGKGSNSLRLLAPSKTAWFWIDPLAWANWRVVCLFERNAFRSMVKIPSFVIALGYDGKAAKPWCAVELYNQPLSDIWEEVRSGEIGEISTTLGKGNLTVQVNLKHSVDSPGVVEVRV